MSNTIEAQEFRDDFYTVETRVRQRGTWKALASVYRSDVRQEVGCLISAGDTQEQALLNLNAKLPGYLASLKRPPHQWGRSELLKLLIDYRRYHNALTNVSVDLRSQKESNSLSLDKLLSTFNLGIQEAVRGAMDLTWRLAEISEQDRIDLMTSAEEAYRDPSNDWNFDDLDGRAALFEYIHRPSTAVREAHATHLANWNPLGGQHP